MSATRFRIEKWEGRTGTTFRLYSVRPSLIGWFRMRRRKWHMEGEFEKRIDAVVLMSKLAVRPYCSEVDEYDENGKKLPNTY